MDAPGWTKHETSFGDIFTRGSEIHFDPNHKKGSMTLAEFRGIFQAMLDKYSFITTRVPHGMSDEFTRRIGFEVTWTDDFYTYYMLTHVPFTKRRKDQ